jgi:hypothetical protein
MLRKLRKLKENIAYRKMLLTGKRRGWKNSQLRTREEKQENEKARIKKLRKAAKADKGRAENAANPKRPPDWKKLYRWVAVAALGGIVAALAIFYLIYRLLFAPIGAVSKTWELSDVITATATAIGGLTIGGAALIQLRKHKFLEYQTTQQLDAQLGEQLRKAIEHLGSDKEHIRLGAIYELKRLAEDSSRDRDSIVRILASFIESRKDEYAPPEPEEGTAPENKPKPEIKPDVRAAATIASAIIKDEIERTAAVSTKKHKKRPADYVFVAAKAISWLPLEYKNNFFPWEKLFAMNLDLFGIRLWGADLTGADLWGTNLRDAVLTGATLTHANLTGAALSYAYLAGAKLSADLLGAHLSYAHLSDAHLSNAHLSDADLSGADLSDADLSGADLSGADLTRAHLAGTDLWNATYDSDTKLWNATYNDTTKLSPGVWKKYFKGKARYTGTKTEEELAEFFS